ncbi:hypothetical protein C8D72_0986 [Kushneria indalinina DSM 14324]|uniref:Uncharacterized protein n=1 Tax=Kushneria indalinina DSM 14324 TaxID=1122140 RepID=A0A3D9E1G6_9GAMM|nr:hypothetical protein C8D72_0986 [Kushneria indalinina DSM 14324]
MSARIGLWAGPLWIVATLLMPPPGDMAQKAWRCAGLALLMDTWWATQALPLAMNSIAAHFHGTSTGHCFP